MHTTEALGVLYVGADLHGNNVYLSVCDAEGREVFGRRVKPELEAVKRALQPYWAQIKTVAVESTFNWYWFVDGLQEAGLDVRLANPAAMEPYTGLKVTDDAHDARWLAEQLRLGILPECYIYPKESRPVRDLLRRRMLLVRQHTQAALSLKALLARQGRTAPSVSELHAWTEADVAAAGPDPFSQLQARSLLQVMRHLQTQIATLTAATHNALKVTPSFDQLQQLPGVGPILGMTIQLETGTFDRFPAAGHYASYCRAVRSERTSNNKRKGQNNTRNGNPYLAWAFSEAAVAAIRFYPRIHAWYERKRQRRNRQVALKALSCKLAKAAWHVMHGKDFDEALLFG